MKFTDKITEIWNNEELDNETKLATLLEETKNFVPKKRIDDYSERITKLEQEKSELSTQFDELKQSTMTEDEKKQAEIKNAKMKANKMAVENLLLKGGLTSEDYTDEDLSLLASNDNEENIAKLTNLFITSIEKSVEKAKQDVTNELLQNTPKPNVGNPNGGTVSKIDDLQTQLNQAIENKDELLQAQLYQQIAMEQASTNVQQ